VHVGVGRAAATDLPVLPIELQIDALLAGALQQPDVRRGPAGADGSEQAAFGLS